MLFLLFLAIFADFAKVGIFLKTNVEKQICCTLSQSHRFFLHCFGKNNFKIIASVPGVTSMYVPTHADRQALKNLHSKPNCLLRFSNP
jgi:hypothetical protein